MLFVSPQLVEMFGHRQDAWRAGGDAWREFIHEDDREAVLAELAQSIEDERHFSAEYRLVCRDGDIVWVHEEARVAKNPRDPAPLLTGVLRDITSRKQSEKAGQEERAAEGPDQAPAESPERHEALEHLTTERDRLCEENETLCQEVEDLKAMTAALRSQREALEARLGTAEEDAAALRRQVREEIDRREQAIADSEAARKEAETPESPPAEPADASAEAPTADRLSIIFSAKLKASGGKAKDEWGVGRPAPAEQDAEDAGPPAERDDS
jgi:PAS domain S-box-containing protein